MRSAPSLPFFMMPESAPPEIIRMAIHGVRLCSSMPKLWMGMMFGCSRRAITFASRLKRSANPSSWRNSRGRILRATYRSSPGS